MLTTLFTALSLLLLLLAHALCSGSVLAKNFLERPHRGEEQVAESPAQPAIPATVVGPQEITHHLPHLDAQVLHAKHVGDGEFVGGQAGVSEGDILRFLASQLVAKASVSQPEVVARHALQAHLLDGRHLGVARGRLELQRRNGVLEHVENIPGWEAVDPSLGILKVQFVAELARLTEVAQELELRAAIGELLQWNVVALAFTGLEHRRLERLVELKIERQAGALNGGEAAGVVDDLVLSAGELGIVEPGL